MKKVLIIIMLSLTCGLNAQRLYHSQHLRFDNITIEDGLPGNSAHAFMQDRLGYLWMGTFNGLVRYDGVNFTVFKENPTENSLTGKFITSLFEDSTGKIWIGTMFHGLNSYEPQTGKFTHFPYDPEQDNSLTWSYVTSINEDEYGRIWVSTINGLNYLEKEPQTSEYKVHSFYPSLYSEKLIQHIYHNKENYPIIELAEVKNNVHLKKEFEVKEATLALIVYEGEYGGKGKLSDYGWITDENDANIWEADYEKSRQDGANYKKRLQIELQTLSPGQYQLNYKSDSDFCYGDFYYPNEVRPFDKVNRKESPEHDSLLWGIKVILLPQKEGKVIQELLETGHVSKEETIQNARIYTLFRDNESQLWIGSAGGLSQIQWSEDAPEAIRFKHFSPNENKGMGLQSDIITQIKQKDKNTLSIVGMSYDTDKNYGLTIENFKPKKEQFQTIYKNPEISNYTQILEQPNNNIWVASFSDGLYSLKPSQNSKLPYPYTSQKQAMPNDFVWQLFQDKSGIAWAGTWQAGGFKLNSSVNIFPFYTIEEHTNTKKEDLAVTSVLEDSEENLWLGTRGIGLYKWDRKTHLFEHFTNKDGLIDGAIKCLKEDKKGNLWIGTSNGVNCYEPSSQKFRSYSHNKDSHHSSDRVQVLDIEEDKAGRIWLGSEQGLFLYQAEKDDFIKIPLAKNHPDLETEWVNKITFDNDGNLWLACYFEGIIKTKVDDLVSHLEFKEIERFYDVTGLDIIDVYIDKKDQLWLGDHQVGLQVMNISTKENYQYPREDKTKLNNVSVIADDEQGNLWLSNSTGLSVFNKTDKSFRTYTKNDGINFDFAKPGPIVRTRRGEFLLGGINGFYLFKPENVKAPEIPPNVVITDFKLFNQSLKVGENNVLKQHISYSEELNLTYEQNTIAISYAGLHFDKPKSIQYAYQLKGVDKKWMEVGEENIARYANLSPGSYSFKVKAANRGGDWSPKIAELKINISPPWWKTTWFYLLGFVLTSILFFYVYNVQLTRELERSEAKRLKDLDEMKSRFFVNVAHELRTPLTLILGPLSSITKRGGLDGRTFTDLKLMRSNGKLLLKLINEILELSRLEANKIELKEKPTLIYPLMHRSIAAFESGAQYRDIQLTFLADFDKRLQLLLDVSKFEKILFNLIINALKFTNKGGKVKITGEDLGHLIQIKIEDTGQGIHPEDLPRIFDRFYQSSRPNAIAQGGTGVGLALSKQFAQVLGGDLTVESVLGEGSTFIFTFPKNEVFGVAEEPKILEMEEVGEGTNDLAFNYQDGVASLVPTTETILSKPKRPKAHLLIVEDNPDMQIYIQSVVSENYNVTVVENGQEALDYMKKTEESNHLPSLIISDVMMPIMGGFSLLEKIKANEKWRSIPVIMLTARVEKEDRLRALRIGVDDYLTKPFVQDELLVRIANLLHNYHQRQAISKKSEKEWIEVLNPKEQLKQTVAKKKEITNKDDLEWLENLEKIMKAKVNDAQFTVSQLAYDLHISERQIYRKIKELTGLSPNKYLKEVRLQTARTLLENHDCSTVKEACYSVGFRKVSYFSKQFQERFGKLPSEFL